MIGKMEEVVLLATIRAGEKAVPSVIYEQIIASTPPGEKEPAFGAVYTTITRMAGKGMLSQTKTTDERGRERKCFTVTAAGSRSLQAGLSQTASLGGYSLQGALV